MKIRNIIFIFSILTINNILCMISEPDTETLNAEYSKKSKQLLELKNSLENFIQTSVENAISKVSKQNIKNKQKEEKKDDIKKTEKIYLEPLINEIKLMYETANKMEHLLSKKTKKEELSKEDIKRSKIFTKKFKKMLPEINILVQKTNLQNIKLVISKILETTPTLSFCTCPNVTNIQRIIIILNILNESKNKLSNMKNKEITYTSLGSGEALQEELICAILAKNGFKKIELNLIDPNYFSPDQAIGRNETIKNTIINSINKLGGKININFYNRYKGDFKSENQQKCQLFTLIDPGSDPVGKSESEADFLSLVKNTADPNKHIIYTANNQTITTTKEFLNSNKDITKYWKNRKLKLRLLKIVSRLIDEKKTDPLKWWFNKSKAINVNDKLPGGYTLLHKAAESDNHELFDFLIEKGADPYAKTKDGKTPLDIANESQPFFSIISFKYDEKGKLKKTK
ncbi:ankyrin repeat domain-containing protein [Candidatus Dependentiae bacterium]